MKLRLFTASILMVFLLGACNNGGQKTKKRAGSGSEKNDSILVTKTFYPRGGLQRVNRGKKVVIDGIEKYVMDGEVLEYYKTPKNTLASRAMYKNGKRNGMYYKYYTNGKLYYELPYENGKPEGVKKMYYEDGTLMSETPYKKGLIGVGSKEYTSKGILKDPPQLKVWYKKHDNGSVTVYAKVLNDGKVTKRVVFYNGYLIEGKYCHKNLKEIEVGSNGVAEINIVNPMSYIVISAKVKSARSVYHLLTKGINI